MPDAARAPASQPLLEQVAAKLNLPRGRTAAELLAETPDQPNWIIPGLLARTWMVKFAAREKVGKGELVMNCLGCVERGEATVFGSATAPTTALIYTEEPADSIREKVAHARLSKARIVFGYELTGLEGWKAKVNYLAQLVEEEKHGILFVDNISRASGCDEEAGTELARNAEYVAEKMRAVGAATIVDHHHRKASGKLEDKSRGGTALAGACDNNIEVERVGDWDSRVRKISSRGRVSSTIWTCQVALSEDATRYELVADTTQPQTTTERHRLALIAEAPEGLTRAEFEALAEINKSTATRTLQRFVEEGRVVKSTEATPRYSAVETPVEPKI